ncbi:MAG: hypothetical protein ACFFC7_03100 [Candidatus Hermodarchaeota archaeon]
MAYAKSNKEFYGIVLATIEDIGPDLTFNKSVLANDEAMLLAIQTFTLVGIGTGAPEGFHGPLPVPKRPDMQTLIYTFVTSGVDSADVRVQKHGRQRALFLLFRTGSVQYDSSMIEALSLYVEGFLKRQEDLTEETFEEFKEVIENSALFYIDRIGLYAKEIEKARNRIRELEIQNTELKRLLTTSKTSKSRKTSPQDASNRKLHFLEIIANQNDITQGLLLLWSQKNKEMPLSQLAKALGIHGGQIRFKLHKYTKCGLLEITEAGIIRIIVKG